jgi:hypothetical protein
MASDTSPDTPPMRLAFTGFWPGFDARDNYFVKQLDHSWELSSDPQVTICSCFDREHRKYENSLKIFFTGENVRSNMLEYDHAISFDLDEREGRCIRWPLYNLYQDPKFSPVADTREDFCCMVVSNPRNDKRIGFFHALEKYRPVDSGGKTLNNVGGPVADKMEFIKRYKFCIAFENSYYPGYTTEKLLQAKKAGCIPIYWGNPEVALDFDTKSFVNAHAFKSFSQCIEYIKYLDNDEMAYATMQARPILNDNSYTRYSDPERFKKWLNTVVAEGRSRKKIYLFSWVAQRLNRYKTNIIDSVGETKFPDDVSRH